MLNCCIENGLLRSVNQIHRIQWHSSIILKFVLYQVNRPKFALYLLVRWLIWFKRECNSESSLKSEVEINLTDSDTKFKKFGRYSIGVIILIVLYTGSYMIGVQFAEGIWLTRFFGEHWMLLTTVLTEEESHTLFLTEETTLLILHWL